MKTLLGIFLIFLVLLLTGLELLALLDPVGTQAANDADPFGTPPPAWVGLIQWAGLSFLCSFAAWRLLKKTESDELKLQSS